MFPFNELCSLQMKDSVFMILRYFSHITFSFISFHFYLWCLLVGPKKRVDSSSEVPTASSRNFYSSYRGLPSSAHQKSPTAIKTYQNVIDEIDETSRSTFSVKKLSAAQPHSTGKSTGKSAGKSADRSASKSTGNYCSNICSCLFQ